MGRPKAEINGKHIERLASLGTKVEEIAEIFGVHRDTIHSRFPTELRKGRANLKESLRKAQIRAAKLGNSTMLIWLGKQYLGQSDSSIDDYLLDAINEAGISKDDLLELIKHKDLIRSAETKKKSFHEFCKASDYPVPFDKQVEMKDFVIECKDPRLLLGSRGYGKTDYAVIMGLAYEIYLDPLNSTTLIITKSKERNAAMLREIHLACVKNGVVFERANSTHIRAAGLIGKDHSISAVTIKTVSLRGRHPKRTVMDDPVTEDDVSEATRAHVKRVYNEVMKLCKNVAIIGQPAHKHDLYADLRDLVKKLEVPHGTIPELDHDLEAQRLAGVDEASISASYHLKILTDGQSPFDKVNYMQSFPTGNTAVAFIDPSFEGGDYTALSIVKQHMDGIAVVGFCFKKAWNHCLDELLVQLKKYNVKKLAFETNSLGDMPIDILRQGFGDGMGVIGRKSNGNKHSRIMSAGAYAHLIHLSRESHKVYLDQVTKYEYKAEHDDAPDSLASCLEWIGLIRGKK